MTEMGGEKGLSRATVSCHRMAEMREGERVYVLLCVCVCVCACACVCVCSAIVYPLQIPAVLAVAAAH